MKTTHLTGIDGKQAAYAKAERLVRTGKQLVNAGFVVSILGIVAYCLACFWATLNQKVGGVLYDNPGWLLLPTLGTIGLGTLVWLAGSVLHLKGAMECDPNQTKF